MRHRNPTTKRIHSYVVTPTCSRPLSLPPSPCSTPLMPVRREPAIESGKPGDDSSPLVGSSGEETSDAMPGIATDALGEAAARAAGETGGRQALEE